jgi:hypothetical protein
MPAGEPGPCLLCGAPHATCGRPGSPAVPVDRLITIPKGDPVLKKYRTTVNGMETTLKLSDADAEAYPGELTEVSGSAEDPQADEVARDEASGEEQTKAQRAPANKARTAQTNKSG